jgi:hypothetical protein
MRIRLVLVLLGLILSSPCPALAVPIDVGGSLAFGVGGGGGPNVNLVGNSRGFTVNGFTDEVDAFLGPFGCRPCQAGAPINVNVVALGTSVRGSATLDGKTFGLGGLDSPGILNLFLSGAPFFAPPLNVAPLVALTSPVNFVGDFRHVDDPSLPPFTQQMLDEQLRAAATATVVLKRFDGPCGPSAVGCWDLASATYELTPTPEPTTLFLLGTTMAGIGLARWRHRRTRASSASIAHAVSAARR